MSSRRTLPEHTVDCWVSAEVLTSFPNALLWAPTQRGADNWDTAFATYGSGKAFILENKGCLTARNSDNHRIEIDTEQLDSYTTWSPIPVYYILPDPPWTASSSIGTLTRSAPAPFMAACRQGHFCERTNHLRFPHPPFSEWSYVVEARILADHLNHWSLPGDTKFRKRSLYLSEIPGLHPPTLREFLCGISECIYGGPFHKNLASFKSWRSLETHQMAPDSEHSARARNTLRSDDRVRQGSPLAIFLPMNTEGSDR